MQQFPALGVNLSSDNVHAYGHWVNTLPMLSLADEKRLAHDYHDHGTVESARQLVLSHLRVVVKVARNYRGYGLNEADLIQEGNIGLMKAVKRFNPDQGVRLVSFAIHWIKAEMHEFILRNWRIVKVATTKAQRKLFFNLRKMKKQLTWFKQNEVDELAQNLDVKPETVREMEGRMYFQDAAFDAAPGSDDEAAYAPADYLADSNANPELLLANEDSASDAHSRLESALAQLDERSRLILNARYLSEHKETLHDLAKQFNVSAERIRQLEKQALDKLKEAM